MASPGAGIEATSAGRLSGGALPSFLFARQVPDYYEIVKDPVDLGLIQKRIESGEYYVALEIFAADVRCGSNASAERGLASARGERPEMCCASSSVLLLAVPSRPLCVVCLPPAPLVTRRVFNNCRLYNAPDTIYYKVCLFRLSPTRLAPPCFAAASLAPFSDSAR